MKYFSSRIASASIMAFLAVLVLMSCGAAPLVSSGPFESEATQAGIRVSQFPDRRHSRALNGATLEGEAYIFFSDDAEPSRVSFALESAPTPIYRNEKVAPFDLMGNQDGASDLAAPLDTRTLPDGTHELVVELATPSGGEVRYQATFETRNGVGAASQGDIYVAPDGSDSSDGSEGNPLASLQAAVDRAEPGDLIYVRGGIYPVEQTVEISRSGTELAPIRLLAYPGETPVLDGSNLPEHSPILRLRESYWVIKGLEIRNGPWFGIFMEYAQGNHLEDLSVHGNGGTGLYLEHHASWNTFVRIRAFANYDPESGGEHADGFAVTRRTAIGNVFLECSAWNNSDDGFDFLESSPQRIERSEASRNGYSLKGKPYRNGNGNGFKLGIAEGRWEAGGGHIVIRSVAWGNKTWGFNSNNGTVPVTVLNSTGWANGTANFLFNKAEHVLINNLSFEGEVHVTDEVEEANNSWQLGIREPKFVSLEPSDPRFLHLESESPAIDAGIDVGVEYAGAAPDLGAFERF